MIEYNISVPNKANQEFRPASLNATIVRATASKNVRISTSGKYEVDLGGGFERIMTLDIVVQE